MTFNTPRYIPGTSSMQANIIRFHDTTQSYNMMMEYLKNLSTIEQATEEQYIEIKRDSYQWRLDGKDEVVNKFFKYVI